MADEKRLVDVMPFMKTGWHLVRTGKSNEHLASMSLADVPTVDAVEVVHTKAVPIYSNIDYGETLIRMDSQCPKCGALMLRVDNYCPNCGAKMDGDGDG